MISNIVKQRIDCFVSNKRRSTIKCYGTFKGVVSHSASIENHIKSIFTMKFSGKCWRIDTKIWIGCSTENSQNTEYAYATHYNRFDCVCIYFHTLYNYCQIKSHPSAANTSCFKTLFPMILISEALIAQSPLRFLGLSASTPYSGNVPCSIIEISFPLITKSYWSEVFFKSPAVWYLHPLGHAEFSCVS